MPDSPSTWIQFVANSAGELELVITREVWEVLAIAARSEEPPPMVDGSVKIDLKSLFVGKGIASIQWFPSTQNPPCQHTVMVNFVP